MNTFEMAVLIGLGSVLAGFVGALTGLGGGVVIVPLLTLVFGVDIRYAIGASLVSVIATSSSAASAIATPIVRVFFSIFVFARQKDWLYVWVTLFVFLLLIFSLTYGK